MPGNGFFAKGIWLLAFQFLEPFLKERFSHRRLLTPQQKPGQKDEAERVSYPKALRVWLPILFLKAKRGNPKSGKPFHGKNFSVTKW
jgi:hypothetical protein